MQTIEFETAKKLVELGIDIIPDTWWNLSVKNDFETAYLISRDCIENYHLHNANELELYPAYTLDEILGMLPAKINGVSLIFYKQPNKENPYYLFAYPNKDFLKVFKSRNKNPAEAAAQLLLWCIEHGYVKVEELNNAND